MVKYKFTLIGGDMRMVSLAKYLRASYQSVNAHMLCSDESVSGVKFYGNIEKAMADTEILVLPMPITRDGINVFTVDKGHEVSIENVLKCAKKYNVEYVLGGNISPKVNAVAGDIGVTLIDYSLSEKFLDDNAYATAEGGLMIAMENTSRTIRGCNAMVSGYGRIAKHLVSLLLPMGVNITVAARSDKALSNAKSMGCDTVSLNNATALKDAIGGCELIFNTVPAHIFRGEHIGEKNSSTYIELASCPGGIELRSARDAGMNIIFAPSLPGRYSPESAGKYIFDSIAESLKERGIYI